MTAHDMRPSRDFPDRHRLIKIWSSMRPSRQLALLLSVTIAALGVYHHRASAQTGVTAPGIAADQPAPGGEAPSQSSTTSVPGRSPSDSTLEIAPRVPPPAPPLEPAPAPDSGANGNDSAPPPDNVQTATPPNPLPPPTRPYLGIAVQTIYTNDRPNGLVNGLEVVSVDPNSPAAIAGLHGRTKMSSVGETGATVGALMPPLNLFVMPLLKKTGSLGEGGDLIVAIDDRRVATDFDLESQLESLKPGDVIYLTIVRAAPDGSQQKMKLPIKLGDSSKVAEADDAQPSAGATTAPPKP
jgi:PDZ domain-containing protein